MAWQSFTIRPPGTASVVAEQLARQFELAVAIHLPLSSDVAVFKRERLDDVRFYFSDAAVELFKTLVQFHGAKPCRKPVETRGMVRMGPAAW